MKFKKLLRIIIFIIFLVCILNIRNFGKILYPIKYSEYVCTYANEYNIDPYMVFSVIKAESNFNAEAKSHKNALGLMQITPPTAGWIAQKMGIENFEEEKLLDPELNIRMGCWYLDNLRIEFKGDINLVLAAYNGGRGNVKKWLRNNQYSRDGKTLYNIPFKETDEYVKKVNANYNIYFKLYEHKELNSKR